MKCRLALDEAKIRAMRYLGIPLLVLAALAGCGGGGDDGGDGAAPPPQAVAQAVAPAVTPLAYRSSSAYAGRCEFPRYGDDRYKDRAGSWTLEKYWLRSWIDETYLWYGEVPKRSPNGNDDPLAYFDALKTRKLGASGRPKDRYHYSRDTAEWVADITRGESIGYGMQIALLKRAPPREAVVVYTDPGTPATQKSIRRGARIVSIDGVSMRDGDDTWTLDRGLFPEYDGESHRFVLRDVGASKNRSVTLTARKVTSRPVQNVKVLTTTRGKVGYLLFNDHSETAESQLVAAVNALKAKGPIKELVLDLRYNGGGYLAIASQAAYMIAGRARTEGRTFERRVYNAKNPFNETREDATMPFFAVTRGYSTTSGKALPSLNLSRVFVLTGAGTCSASEAIVNGLRGVGVQVVQIGATTCGKPYGFYPQDNCGTTYFAIQFRGVNAKGYGGYDDGFVPAGKGANGVRGCVVADDFDRALGNPGEARLKAALNFIRTGNCKGTPASAGKPERDEAGDEVALDEPLLLRSELRENRF